MEEKAGLMTVENISRRVYVIRGQQVKRNIARFPEDFMFQLTKEEVPEECLKSQFATLNENRNKRGLHMKKLPYAFTEQGIYMLATVLWGELAEQQSIFIMRAFREMRHFIRQNRQFVTQSEMRLVNAQMSEMAVKMDTLSDRQLLRWSKELPFVSAPFKNALIVDFGIVTVANLIFDFTLQTKGARSRRLQVSGTKDLQNLLQLTFLQEAHRPLHCLVFKQTFFKEQFYFKVQRFTERLIARSL